MKFIGSKVQTKFKFIILIDYLKIVDIHVWILTGLDYLVLLDDVKLLGYY